MPTYAVVDPESGIVLSTMMTPHRYVEIDTLPEKGKNHVLRNGGIEDAPVAILSIGRCEDMPGQAQPGLVDNLPDDEPPLAIPPPHVPGRDPKSGPVDGCPFELLAELPEAWRDSPPRKFKLQINDLKTPRRWVPGQPVILPAGEHHIQIIGPPPWRSKKLTIEVAEAPEIPEAPVPEAPEPARPAEPVDVATPDSPA